MLVIGIDPGTALTGYGLVREDEAGQLVAVAYGVVETPAKAPMPQRLSSTNALTNPPVFQPASANTSARVGTLSSSVYPTFSRTPWPGG